MYLFKMSPLIIMQRYIPWLDEGLSILFLRLLFLRYRLPDGALPVLVEFSLYHIASLPRDRFPSLGFQFVIRNIHRLPGILVMCYEQYIYFHLGCLRVLCLLGECSCFHAVCHYWKYACVVGLSLFLSMVLYRYPM